MPIEGKRRLSERVFDYILDSILSGSIESNSRVVERKVAEEIGISHVPVREALEKLEHDGWIERLPQRGARVKEYNEKEIENLFQFRKILECGSLGIIKYPLFEDKKTLLSESFHDLVVAQGDENLEKAVKADTSFHQSIVQCTENDRMIAQHRTIVLQLRASLPVFLFGALDLAFGQKLKYEDLQLSSHRKIYEAIITEKSKLASDLLSKHIVESSKCIKIIRSFNEKLKSGILV